jgi:hypothetical protein
MARPGFALQFDDERGARLEAAVEQQADADC